MAMSAVGPILVTGASTGIGRATTELLAKRGCLVYATARKKADLRALGDIPNVVPVRLDVTKPEEVRRAADFVARRGRGLYGLVNNAGVGIAWPLPELDIEDMIQEFDVNVYGVHRVTRAMLPFLVEAKGRIVNISSIGGLNSAKYIGAYFMTKHALEVYSEVLSRWLRKYKVKVSIVEPGTYRSRITQKGARRVRRIARAHPRRFMKQEVKEVLEWLPKAVRSAEREPRPTEIPEAIVDALVSKRPKRRYCVGANRGELLWALEGPMTRAVQANQGGGKYSLTQTEMHALLDKIWDRETNRP